MAKFKISITTDFGKSKGFYINDQYVKLGYMVTLNGRNIMPNNIYFKSIAEAMKAFDVWMFHLGDEDEFWKEWLRH